MLFSTELKAKLTKVFCRENIKNKLTKEEIKNGIKMERNDLVFSYPYFVINIIFILFFCLIFNTLKYNLFGEENYNGLTLLLSVIIPLTISLLTAKYLCIPFKKSIKTLEKNINKETIMNTLKLSLKEIINDAESNDETVIEAKNYISMLAQGKEDLIYQKIMKEKIFSVRSIIQHSNILQEYYVCCLEKKSILEQKILSSEEITKIKINKLEESGFNAKLEINKILENI